MNEPGLTEPPPPLTRQFHAVTVFLETHSLETEKGVCTGLLLMVLLEQ